MFFDGPRAFSSASFTRPADTTGYTAGDLIANSVTAGSVVPLALTVPQKGTAEMWKLKVSGSPPIGSLFSALIFASPPLISVGDNGALASGANVIGSTESNFVCLVRFGFTNSGGRSTSFLFSDSLRLSGTTDADDFFYDTKTSPMWSLPSGQTIIYALLFAGQDYTPSASQILTLSLRSRQLIG